MGPTQTAVLLDLPLKDVGLLRRFGVAESQLSSWDKRRRNKEPMHELVALARPDPNNTLHVEDRYAETNDTTSLDGYFANVFASGIQALRESGASRMLLAINLMPYHLSLTLVDKLAAGLMIALAQEGDRPGNLHLLFLARNTDWFAKSQLFLEAVRETTKVTKYTVIDVRGYRVAFHRAGVTEESLVERDKFQRILAFNQDAFYRSLIYGTNSFLGHFHLRNSHVRTHYDLSQFIQRDDVQEHLAAEFGHLISGSQAVTILGVGLEQRAIDRFGLFVRSRFEDRVRAFEYVLNPTEPTEYLACCEGCDCAVILTDIVNSGRTLVPLVEQLKRRTAISLKIYTIIRMDNSPDAINEIELSAAVRLRREFYSNDPNQCPLCQVQQPARIVSQIDDFKYVASEQPTPYDFWELVLDSKALQEDLPDAQGRRLAYRVDTAAIVRHYRYWLRNVIRAKYDSTWPGRRPASLCTIDEATGVAFAELVAKSLDVRTDIIKLSRDELRSATASGGPLVRRLDDIKMPLLIVDDGINYGHTMESLINFCRFSKITPIGALVFDSRLEREALSLLRKKMGGQPILSLYTWPSPPVPTDYPR